MIADTGTLQSRASKAAVVGAYNLIIFILVPALIGGAVEGIYPSSPLLVPLFIYEYGAIITALQVLGTLTDGSPISVPFVSGGYIAAAFFVWIGSNGGRIPLTYDGVNVSFAFQPVVFLMLVPFLFLALREPVVFLLERSEAGRPSPDLV